MIIPQTVAFDETENPQPFPWAEYVVVGPRITIDQASAIRAVGSKLIIKVQPVRWIIDGQPYLGASWDRVLQWLPYLETPTLAESGEGMDGSFIIDFRSALAQNLSVTLAALAQQRGAMGIMFDYGSEDIQGTPEGWATGYGNYRQRVMTAGYKIWNCTNRAQKMGGSLMFENIRANGLIDGYPPNYAQIRSRPGGQHMLLIQNNDVRHRRIICGMALESGYLVNYRPYFFTNRWYNEVPPEMVF